MNSEYTVNVPEMIFFIDPKLNNCKPHWQFEANFPVIFGRKKNRNNIDKVLVIYNNSKIVNRDEIFPLNQNIFFLLQPSAHIFRKDFYKKPLFRYKTERNFLFCVTQDMTQMHFRFISFFSLIFCYILCISSFEFIVVVLSMRRDVDLVIIWIIL